MPLKNTYSLHADEEAGTASTEESEKENWIPRDESTTQNCNEYVYKLQLL